MAALPDAAIEAYVASGRPLDKAGAYAIQDEDVPTVASWSGCYCAVMGLPLWRVRVLLEQAGVRCGSPDAAFARCAACPERELAGRA
jgi:septum formation protein